MTWLGDGPGFLHVVNRAVPLFVITFGLNSQLAIATVHGTGATPIRPGGQSPAERGETVVSSRCLMPAIMLATHLSCASASVFTAPPPSDRERYCAWLGDVGEGVLYFGESAFWSAAWLPENDALADLLEPGPRPIGRFDLAEERMLPPLDIPGDSRSGIWDVLFHPNGRVYFTSFFETSGWVDSRTAEVQLLPHLGD